MAAGGVDVPRRSGIVGHTKKDYECYRSGTRDLNSRWGGRHGEKRQNGYHKFSYEHDCCSGARQKNGHRERGEVGEDCGVKWPPEKKRKFSPIIWDIEDKKVIVPSGKSEPAGTTQSLLRSVGGISAVVTDGGITTSPPSENQVGFKELEELVPPESLALAASPSGEQNFTGDFEGGQVEEEDEVRAPNIATSRWALDRDPKETSISDDADIAKTNRWDRSSSTTESGEFLIEESEGKRSRSSGSGRGGQSVEQDSAHDCSDNELESGELLDIDEMHGDSPDVSLLEDEEPTTFAQGGMNMLLGSRSVDEYEKLNKISEGTYGVVYRAKDKKTGEIVALKKVKMNFGREAEYGFPLTSLREINILLSCTHPSIVNVKEVAVGKSDGVFMVMEHLEHDLKGITERMRQPFSSSEVKCLMLQLLEGVNYLHSNWIIHRDLKPSNLLLNNRGEMKICDFGMSRQYGSPLKPYTQLVVTQWYRAPELLLGAKQYSTAIDMWSVGCIMAELLAKQPLFQGKGGSDIDQLHKIFGVLGTPNEKIWPGFSTLPGAKANFVKQPYNLLRKKFPAASFTGSPVLSDLGFDLLNKMLTYDPEKRIAADAALNHDWFHEVPLPKSREFMPTFPPRSG